MTHKKILSIYTY